MGECPSGTFDPAHSSTFHTISEGTFNASYGDKDEYFGDWIADVVGIGGITLVEGLFAIGMADKLVSGPNHPNVGEGLLGISYQSGNHGAPSNDTLPPTALSAIITSGVINRQAYSLSLDAASAGEGVIVFGGVDATRYAGDLVALQILKDPNSLSEYQRLQVPLTGVSVSDGSGTRMLTPSDFAVPALIDSGTTDTKLPSSVLGNLVAGFGVTMVGTDAYLPCSRNSSNASISYHFGGDGGPSIQVPLTNLLSPSQSNSVFADGELACDFGIGPLDSDGVVILGDSFMRSGYFVFDLANNLLAMAAAATSSATGQVTAIPSGTEIPGCSSTNTFTAASTSDVSQENMSQLPTQSSGDVGSMTPANPTFELSGSSTATGSAKPSSSSGAASSATALSLGICLMNFLILVFAY